MKQYNNALLHSIRSFTALAVMSVYSSLFQDDIYQVFHGFQSQHDTSFCDKKHVCSPQGGAIVCCSFNDARRLLALRRYCTAASHQRILSEAVFLRQREPDGIGYPQREAFCGLRVHKACLQEGKDEEVTGDGGVLRRISLHHFECSKHREWSQNRRLFNRNESKEM
jgi:hypothetical protein